MKPLDRRNAGKGRGSSGGSWPLWAARLLALLLVVACPAAGAIEFGERECSSALTCEFAAPERSAPAARPAHAPKRGQAPPALLSPSLVTSPKDLSSLCRPAARRGEYSAWNGAGTPLR